jgi:hypothetical protein
LFGTQTGGVPVITAAESIVTVFASMSPVNGIGLWTRTSHLGARIVPFQRLLLLFTSTEQPAGPVKFQRIWLAAMLVKLMNDWEIELELPATLITNLSVELAALNVIVLLLRFIDPVILIT